jgi:3-oxoadipate enol-lactonase
MNMAFLEVNNAKFYYESHGEGQPLILISGYTADHDNWISVVEPLSEHFNVITFDNRAVGQTEDDGGELSAELMADDVIAIADVLGLEKPHIIGSSMGGTIAQIIGMKYPDKISNLGLMVTTCFWRQRAIQGLGALIKVRESDIDFDLQIDLKLPWVTGQDFLNDPDKCNLFHQATKDNLYPQSIENQKRQYNVLKKFNSMGKITEIQARTLVMYGDEDLLSLPHESEYLASQIPYALPHEFSCGHLIQAELPEEFVGVVVDFFK